MSLEDLIVSLIDHPDEAYIRNDGQEALVFDSIRGEILVLEGNFTGSDEVIAEGLLRAYVKQYEGRD